MISMKYRFIHTNASTFSTGEMWIFGDAYRKDYATAITSFYDGLIAMTKGKMSGKLKDIYHNEQRRVTVETNFMNESKKTPKMFVYNLDMLQGKYPPNYIWRMLLEDTKLVRIFVQTQSRLEEEEKALFKTKAEEFETAWKSRTPGPESKLPLFYAPPLSMFVAEGKELFSLDRIKNPIERDIILCTMDAQVNEFNFKGAFKKKTPKKPVYRVDRTERFFLAKRLASPSPIKSKWVKDLLTLSDAEIVEKYGESALTLYADLIADRR
jgi:hypothetical protein